MRVCRYDEGRASKFYCPYHGWAYNLDGSLSHVTEHEIEYQRRPMDWRQWGLIKVAAIAVFHGTVLGHLGYERAELRRVSRRS